VADSPARTADDPHGDLDLSPKAVRLTTRQIRAIELRSAGWSYRQIADTMGLREPTNAWALVRDGLSNWLSESATELRTLEQARLEAMTRRLWPLIMGTAADGVTPLVAPEDDHGPDSRAFKAMETYLRISERRARLFGLDAPTGVQIDVGGRVDVQHKADPDVLGAVEHWQRLTDEMIKQQTALRPLSAEDDGSDIVDAEVVDE
jgi:hypothetical protein